MHETLPLLEKTRFPTVHRARLDTLALIPPVLAARDIGTLDLTGGAPELHEGFRELVRAARRMGVRVIDRCNLTILFEPGQEGLAQFLAAQQVEVVASLPCYLATNVDKQRGDGVFDLSIAVVSLTLAPMALNPARLLLFAKAPQLGAVKTRLIPALGAQCACALARQMLPAQRVQGVIRTVAAHDGVQRHTELGVEVLAAYARIVDPWTVEIKLNGGRVQRLSTRAIVMAAGASPLVPALDDVGNVNSDTLWDEFAKVDAAPARYHAWLRITKFSSPSPVCP